MLSKISKSPIFLHLAAIFGASLITLLFFIFISKQQVKPPLNGMYIANIGEGKRATENLVALNSALSFGKTVVVLGSSELTTGAGSTYIAYDFLPKVLHVPVLAYGHAHFQSFGIYGLLAANADALSPRTKLVILVSPGWFGTNSLLTEAFIEHFQPQILIDLYQQPDSRALVSQYLESHRNEFNRLSPVQEAFVNNTNVFMQKMAIKESIFSLKTRTAKILSDRDWLLHKSTVPTPVFPNAAQWKEHERIAQASEISRMHTNQRWVRDDYYEKYLKDLPPEGGTYFPANMNVFPELSMLERTLELLRKKNVQALVIMQTLNPFVYKDAPEVKVIAQKVSTLCHASGMQCFDMNDVSQYEPGTLRDGMHVGELGWVRIDRRIMDYIASR